MNNFMYAQIFVKVNLSAKYIELFLDKSTARSSFVPRKTFLKHQNRNQYNTKKFK